MTKKMLMHWSPRSPFVRKVMIVAHEVGLADRIETVRTLVAASTPNVELMKQNPQSRLPTLVLADGTVIYDSPVICEYFDSLHDGPKLFPADPAARWPALKRQALGDGLMELGILRLGEQYRSAAMQSESQLATYRLKIGSGLDRIEAEGLAPAGADIGHIAIGCALGYLDFRFGADDWRHGRPQLSAWFAEFARRPAMRATEHVDVQ